MVLTMYILSLCIFTVKHVQSCNEQNSDICLRISENHLPICDNIEMHATSSFKLCHKLFQCLNG